MESVLLFLVKLIGRIVRLLPLRWALSFGMLIGLLIYRLNPGTRQVYLNLKVAFGKTRSPKEIKFICRQVFIHYAKNFIELLRLPLLNKENYREFVKVEGIEKLQEARKLGKGGIILAMHFGSWELANLGCTTGGFPYKVLVKPQPRLEKLDDYLNSYRAFGGAVVLERGNDTRDILRSLKNNEVVSLIIDQGGKEGELIPFFGKTASFSTGAMRIALKWGVPVCFGMIHRENGGQHRMVFSDVKVLTPTGDEKQDTITHLKDFVKEMEHNIELYPAEYMWFYKIWKYTSQMKIVVLDDGRMGHLRQSQAVAKAGQQAYKEFKYSQFPLESSVEEIQVVFKNELMEKLFAVCGLLRRFRLCPSRLTFLRHFLTEKSYLAIESVKSEMVISCGSATAGINHYLAKDNDAKSIVIQNPGLWSQRNFNLVVLPQHDIKNKKMPKNILPVMGAPNLITEEYLKGQSSKLLGRYAHLQKRFKSRVGLFIGGDSKHIFISERQIRVLVHQLKGILRDIDYDLLVTTSRRTPGRIEQILSRELKNDPHCSLMIIANQQNIPEAVGGILGLSDIVIVSGDSISMVSEAASSGKKVIVFLPEKRVQSVQYKNKHQRFIEGLDEAGHVVSILVEDTASTMMQVVRSKIQTKKLNDVHTVEEAVKKVI